MQRLFDFVLEKKRFFIVVGLLIVFMLAGHFLGIRQLIKPDFIKQILVLNWYISLPLFILLCCLANLTNTPTTIIMTVVVYVTGRNAAIPLIFIGSVASCVFTFFTISLITQNSQPEIKNLRMKKWLNKLEEQPILAIFILRSLFQFAPLLNYALAMSKVKFKDYFIGTFLGLIIPSVLLSFFYEFLVKAGDFLL
ncbi:MAG: VTT domain-containing protein [Bdellovibrionaceae bacterium]|nr:VTT domain-containing protein [Pseudobdellovibrionaceae bacterium]